MSRQFPILRLRMIIVSKFIKYHEMSHASHYSKVGTDWYSQFVNAELAEIVNHPSGNLNPYGDGHSSNSPIIALGEAWAYHMGHYLADQRYGVNASKTNEGRGYFYPNTYPSSYCPSTYRCVKILYSWINRRPISLDTKRIGSFAGIERKISVFFTNKTNSNRCW